MMSTKVLGPTCISNTTTTTSFSVDPAFINYILFGITKASCIFSFPRATIRLLLNVSIHNHDLQVWIVLYNGSLDLEKNTTA